VRRADNLITFMCRQSRNSGSLKLLEPSVPVICLYRDCFRLRLKCDGTRAETRFRLSPKRTNPFKWAGASVQSTAGGRGVRISGSSAGYTTFRGSVKSTGYPLHSPVSPPVHHSVPSGFKRTSTFYMLRPAHTRP